MKYSNLLPMESMRFLSSSFSFLSRTQSRIRIHKLNVIVRCIFRLDRVQMKPWLRTPLMRDNSSQCITDSVKYSIAFSSVQCSQVILAQTWSTQRTKSMQPMRQVLLNIDITKKRKMAWDKWQNKETKHSEAQKTKLWLCYVHEWTTMMMMTFREL